MFCIIAERDSRKDETVVFIFIIATGGLLVWAAVKPWAEKWIEVCFLLFITLPLFKITTRVVEQNTNDIYQIQAARERRSYIPVTSPTEDN